MDLATGRSQIGQMRDARSVLVVDDEPSLRVAVAESLRRSGYGVVQATDGQEALERVAQTKPWLVLTDMKMPRMGGLEVLKEIKRRSPQTTVVVMTAYGTVESAVEAMKHGASDYLLKPFAIQSLERILTRMETEEEDSERCAQGLVASRPILTEDPDMAQLLNVAETVAASQATVLVTGESGTGKELLARFVHSRSPRSHCAALPDGLLESELFGHERGAFTGALIRKLGKFEMAHTGTLLLDEIGEMSLGLQAKLLRVLQEREVDRVGGREPVKVDIRVIATTNRSLRREVDQGRFREDLYYRLHVFPIALPALRERRMDIVLLARHFVQALAARNGLPAPAITPEAAAALEQRYWKGNVRELENVMERALLLAGGGAIQPSHVPNDEPVRTDAAPGAAEPQSQGGNGSLWEMERDLIFKTLARVKGNRTHAAKILGISIRTLRNKLREYRHLTEIGRGEQGVAEEC
jgi:DNA-binding NtrC family response regulator